MIGKVFEKWFSLFLYRITDVFWAIGIAVFLLFLLEEPDRDPIQQAFTAMWLALLAALALGAVLAMGILIRAIADWPSKRKKDK